MSEKKEREREMDAAYLLMRLFSLNPSIMESHIPPPPPPPGGPVEAPPMRAAIAITRLERIRSRMMERMMMEGQSVPEKAVVLVVVVLVFLIPRRHQTHRQTDRQTLLAF